MSEIKQVYSKQELTNQLVKNVMTQQNAILSGKKSDVTAPFANKENEQKDSLFISQEAQMMFEELERMREENKESSDIAEKEGKCMLIAMRIAAGDEVPEKDIKFLMKYNMGLYAKAMQMRIPKPEPEEYDTLLSEEEEREIERADMGFVEGSQLSGTGTALTNPLESFILE